MYCIVIQLCSQNKFKWSFIPQAIKFLNVSDTYVAKLVKILPKIQEEWKSLHIVCLSFYVDVLVFMWLYECQVTSLASQIPYWGQINVSVFLSSQIQCIHILNAFLSSPWDLMVTKVFIKGLMCFLCPQTKYTVYMFEFTFVLGNSHKIRSFSRFWWLSTSLGSQNTIQGDTRKVHTLKASI